jgi:hypothetical protein
MTNTEAIKLILQTYRFETPVPPGTGSRMLKSRKTNLIAILKKVGKYSLITAAVVYLFFLLKKMGITTTLLKLNAVLFVAAGTAATTIVTTTTVATYRHYRAVKVENSQVSALTPPTITLEEATTKSLTTDSAAATEQVVRTEPSAAIQSMRFEVVPFRTTDSANEGISQRLTSNVLKRINDLQPGAAVMTGSAETTAPYLITGSVVKLGSVYTANIRIINRNDSHLVIAVSENFTDPKDINGIAFRLAEKVNADLP